MKKILGVCGALLLSAGTVMAADEMSYAQAPTYNWSGLWAGGHAGYVSGSVTGTPGVATSGPSGADVGLHAYYNFQQGNWVFGPYLGVPVIQKSGSLVAGFTTTAEWGLTGGFRLGYAIDRWLPYGMVAGIVGGASNNFPASPNSNTHTGYALVLGVDYAVTDRWAVGARYAHVSMSKETYGGASGPVGWDADSFVGMLTFKLY